MRGSGLLFATSVFLTPAIAAANGSASLDTDPLIYGGTPVESCGWPSTVSMQGSCTGTLVHPQVVIYAAHCGSGYSSVHFGENVNTGPGFNVPTEFCQTNPPFGPLGEGVDFAFCKLAQPVTDVEIVPILMGCETSLLVPGEEVTVVGFGNANNGPYGIKREVVTTINSVGNEAYIGGNGVGACNGDSGGPVFINLRSDIGGDDTWRVFGVTSWGPQGCEMGAHFGMMHNAVDWVETQSGVDVTPCHDVDGTWNPTIDCKFFPKEPGFGHGSWPACGPGPAGGFSTICGEPAAGPDDDPPTVELTGPESGTKFDTGAGETADVNITAVADDADGWGVQEVRLVINDTEVPNGADNAEPYEWPGAFPAGQYTVTAIAVDYAGNEATADAIYFGVDMDAPVPPDDEGTGTGTDGGDPDGTGSGSTGTGGTGEDDKGCGCNASNPAGGTALAALGLLGLAAFRRRRY